MAVPDKKNPPKTRRTTRRSKKAKAAPTQAKATPKKETRSKTNEGGGGHGAEQGEEASEPSDIYMLEDVIVNPAGTGGTRFLSVSIGFEVGSDETYEMFDTREAIIKDALITILGSKTIQQLSDSKEKEITRYQIRKRIEHLLKVDDVSAVYFTDFILQ